MSDKRTSNKRRDRRKHESSGKSFSQAPIILDRPDRSEKSLVPTMLTSNKETKNIETDTTIEQNNNSSLSVPFLRRPNRLNSETILKKLSDHPGHFVIGVIGKQGVGKSTILSSFAQRHSEHVFPTQEKESFLYEGHKTDGIDMYITTERAILLDTEPVLCWTILEKLSRHEPPFNGLHADLALEIESLYNIIFLMSICNVILFVTDGPEIDMDLLRLIQRAEMLKFCIPDFPLLTGQQDMHYYPDIAFVCNSCKSDEFVWRKYMDLQLILQSFFEKSQLKSQGLVDMGNVLPLFSYKDHKPTNLFFLPDQTETSVESFPVLVSALRDQILACPRRPGRKGQLSEKDWYRNAAKILELIRKSEYISEYLQVTSKLRNS